MPSEALPVVLTAPMPARAALDGSTPLLCPINTIVPQRVVTDGQPSGRKTQIKAVTNLDGRLIQHGGENG